VRTVVNQERDHEWVKKTEAGQGVRAREPREDALLRDRRLA